MSLFRYTSKNTRKLLLLLLVSTALLCRGQDQPDTILFNRADSLIKDGKYAEAVEMYRLYIDASSHSGSPDVEKISESWNNIGVGYYRMREYDKAAASFEVALQIDRENNLESLSTRLSNLGLVFKKQGYYNRAISYYTEALSLAEKSGDDDNTAKILNNIGSIYDQWGHYDKAIENYEKSLRIKEESGNKEGIATSLNNIGMVYQAWNKYEQAILNFKDALRIDVELGNRNQMAIRFNNIGLSFFNMKNYDSAQVYYTRALNLNIELGIRDQVAVQYNNLGMIYLQKKEYDKAGNYMQQALKINQELNLKAEIASILSNLGRNESLKKNYSAALDYLNQSVAVAEEINYQTLQLKNYMRLSDVNVSLKRYDLALEYYKMASAIKDTVFSQQSHEQIADFEVKYETERKQKEIEILQQKELISNLELHRQKIIRNSLFGVIGLVILLAAVSFLALRIRIRGTRIIQQEKSKSDRLLLNILPEKVANDLKETGKTIPESFDNVTVMFSDLCNFTELSAGLEPEIIISELNQLFSQFDSIIERHSCERIKTIGDAYMAVAGLPEPDEDHAAHLVQAAIEIMDYMQERSRFAPIKWELRIGIHTGSVVAGVVGVKKYIYDVFGDTVNTASRMESWSQAMKINVSETTYELLKGRYSFTEREPVAIKGKGIMKMFFLDK